MYNSVPASDGEMTEVRDALHDNLLTCDESLIHRVTPDIIDLWISKLKSCKKTMEINVSHLIIYLILASVYIFYCHYCLSPYYFMDIRHMNC